MVSALNSSSFVVFFFHLSMIFLSFFFFKSTSSGPTVFAQFNYQVFVKHSYSYRMNRPFTTSLWILLLTVHALWHHLPCLPTIFYLMYCQQMFLLAMMSYYLASSIFVSPFPSYPPTFLLSWPTPVFYFIMMGPENVVVFFPCVNNQFSLWGMSRDHKSFLRLEMLMKNRPCISQ